MKIAVFYSGLIRSYQHVYTSINKILPNEHIEFYFHTWEEQEKEKINFTLNSRKWKDFIVEKDIKEYKSNYAKGFYSKMRSFSLIKEADFIVYSRFDNYYWPESKEIDFNNLDPNRFHIIPYCNWHGIEDRFCVGTPHSIYEWANVFELHQKKLIDFDQLQWGMGEKLTSLNISKYKWEHISHIKTSIIKGYKQNILESKRCTPQFNGKENFKSPNDDYQKYLKICNLQKELK